jgi:hypothetical protein
MAARPHLPGIPAEIADAAGIEAALAVAKAKGGTRAYFPERPRTNNWLVNAVGRDKAATIGRLFASGRGGIELEIPGGAALGRVAVWREIYQRLEAGQSKVQIALALGINCRTVQAHANGHRPAARAICAELK